MITLYVLTFLALILAELVKGISANGTPPLLQKYPWQMDLAYLMWTNIQRLRIALVGLLLLLFFWLIPAEARLWVLLASIPLAALWGGVYWLFNRFWVGKYKFLPISQKTFLTADQSQVDPSLDIIGVDRGGVQKAFPVNMLFYHHQITDEIAGDPIWVTYCGLCRSGRVYDINLDGRALTFGLVGAITFNAVFRDDQTGSWWRQETGEAAKGPMQGRALEDIPFEQMTLANWLAKHPGSTVLQYDPAFQGKYNFLAKLLNYEASLPGWHRQETPPLIIGVEAGGETRAYDWEQLRKRRLLNDRLGDTHLLVMSDAEASSAFVYDRRVKGDLLDFTLADGRVTDAQTGSAWDSFGRCTGGPMRGATLRQVQSYRQFLRAWISFHPGTTFYKF